MSVHKSSKGTRPKFCSALFVTSASLFLSAASGACQRDTALHAELAVGIKSAYFFVKLKQTKPTCWRLLNIAPQYQQVYTAGINLMNENGYGGN